ncbi:MAG TPA: hypothetical protein PKI93_08110 [Alphaproteobacteria bacterium]|nr:hypothetical protein [Alphaproteobacteria bacterium]HNS44274.1 hypothetical protein [Alphaproteobacteria bacterium]
MFSQCDFILGENDSIVIVVPGQLPKDMPLTLEVHNRAIVFRSGDDPIADVACEHREILQRLVTKTKVGMVEFLNGIPKFPAYISAVANIEVMIEAAA